MHGGAYPTGALDKSPNVPGVPAFDNGLQPPYHWGGTVGVGNLAVFNLYFYSQVPFNTGDGVYNYSVSHDRQFNGKL
jgi:hypothetical protein